jgi:hypothetical protein
MKYARIFDILSHIYSELLSGQQTINQGLIRHKRELERGKQE